MNQENLSTRPQVRSHRTRRVGKWGGLILCVLIFGGFLVSIHHAVGWHSSTVRYEFQLIGGTVGWGWRPDGWLLEEARYPGTPGWYLAGRHGRLLWWVERGSQHPAWEWLSIPLWMPFLLIAVPTSVVWYRDRRSIREAAARWALRFTPKHHRNVTVRLCVGLTFLHAIGVICIFFISFEVCYFLFPPSASPLPMAAPRTGVQSLFAFVFNRVVPVLLFTAPIWGIFWAWCYARLRNRLFEANRTHPCATCGYDLTGNTSGTCPECGTRCKPTSCGSPAEIE